MLSIHLGVRSLCDPCQKLVTPYWGNFKKYLPRNLRNFHLILRFLFKSQVQKPQCDREENVLYRKLLSLVLSKTLYTHRYPHLIKELCPCPGTHWVTQVAVFCSQELLCWVIHPEQMSETWNTRVRKEDGVFWEEMSTGFGLVTFIRDQ